MGTSLLKYKQRLADLLHLGRTLPRCTPNQQFDKLTVKWRLGVARIKTSNLPDKSPHQVTLEMQFLFECQAGFAN
jgi:hypothetical protein